MIDQNQELPTGNISEPTEGENREPQTQNNDRRPRERRGRDPRRQYRNSGQQGERTERTERPDKPEQVERTDKPEVTDKPQRFERPERMPRPERQQRPERTERPARPERQDRQDRQPRPERENGDRNQAIGLADISVVIPLYNEEQSLRELYDQLRDALQRSGRYEIIFVDDGSTDGSMRVLHDLRNRDKRVKIVSFRRNFGKSAALSVGFKHAKGEYIITMDADLQDDPAEIPALINELKKGFDLVSGWKKKRYDPITKTLPSKFFNFVTSVLTDINLHDFNCGLKAYRKDVVKSIKVYGELHRYIPVLAHWQGFKVTEIPVQHRSRKYGKTKFGMGRFWKGFLDLLTVLFTTRYLRRPLHFFGLWGSGSAFAGFIICFYLVLLKFVDGMPLGNRPLFLGGILLIIVGVQLISLGLLGEMIAKTRLETEEEYSVKEFWK